MLVGESEDDIRGQKVCPVCDIISGKRYKPFTIKNVEVAINATESMPGEIHFIFNFEDNLCYYEKPQDPEDLNSIEVHEETFEEAVEILKNQEKEKRVTLISQ